MAKILGDTIFFEPSEGNLASLLNILTLISNRNLKLNNRVWLEMRKDHSIKEVHKKKRYKFFRSMLMGQKPSRSLTLMAKSGLLECFIPELVKGVGCKQSEKYHQNDTFTHCIKACDAAEPSFEIRAAALLHDIGKPYVKTFETVLDCSGCEKQLPVSNDTPDNQDYHCPVCGSSMIRLEVNQKFFKHEVKSDTLAKVVLRRMGVPKKTGLFIASLVRNHMYLYSRNWTDEAIKRFVRRVSMTKTHINNIERFPLFLVREADRKSRGLSARTHKQEDFERRLKEYFNNTKES